jgi:hypothetical protein
VLASDVLGFTVDTHMLSVVVLSTVRFQAGETHFVLLHSVRTGSGASPPSVQWVLGFPFL